MGYQPDVDAAMEQAIAAMQAAGATVVDADIATLNDWNGAEFMVLKYELKAGLARYLTESGAPVTSLAGLIEFNREHAEREMPFFGQDIFEQAQALGPLTDAAYLDARETTRRLAGPEGHDAALARPPTEPPHGLEQVIEIEAEQRRIAGVAYTY